MLSRRSLIVQLSAAALSLFTLSGPAFAEPLAEVRIGYQKNGILPIARQQKVLEERFSKAGIGVKWVDFVAGPPMLEAMSAGAIDFGAVGDAPPIFAQAAGANIVYAAAQRVTNGQGILVKPDSPIRSIADLKGKRVAFHKGSSAHNVIIAALESAGLAYADITPIFLSPPDAAAAFARGSVDAWAVWDPYMALAERTQNARVLVDGVKVAASNSFFLANKSFAAEHPKELAALIDTLGGVARWAESHRGEVAEKLAAITGVEIEAQRLAAERAGYGIEPITDDIVATQQKIADRFAKLAIIPRAIQVSDAVWAPPAS